SPPDSTVHSAIISISSRSCRPALPVRGSSKPSKQAVKPSIAAPCDQHQGVESIRPEPGNCNISLSSKFQMRFPWGLPSPPRRPNVPPPQLAPRLPDGRPGAKTGHFCSTLCQEL